MGIEMGGSKEQGKKKKETPKILHNEEHKDPFSIFEKDISLKGKGKNILEVKAESPEGSSINIHIEKRTPLSAGTDEKFLVTGFVNGHRLSFVERWFDSRYVENWKAFKKAGLPVVPTLRETEHATMLLTNIKADGSETYGKHRLYDFDKIKGNEKADNAFLQLTSNPHNFLKIQEKVEQCKDIANKNGLLLPTDDPFELLVHPGGAWNLIMLDLDSGGVNKHSDNQNHNEDAKNEFLSTLQFLRYRLLV